MSDKKERREARREQLRLIDVGGNTYAFSLSMRTTEAPAIAASRAALMPARPPPTTTTVRFCAEESIEDANSARRGWP